MIRSLLKLGALLLVVILVYNYFFGTVEEKAQSKKVFTEVVDLGKSAWGLLKSEKAKMDDGKYDGALEKISGLIDNLKKKANTLKDNKEILDQIRDLETKKEQIEDQLAEKGSAEEKAVPKAYGSDGEDTDAQIKEDWKSLLEDTERLMKKMEGKE